MTIRKQTGSIIESWEDGGHRFQIEQLECPRVIGSHERNYRLWMNGEPATGAQWHATIDRAKARAEYIAQGTLLGRLQHLENIVFGKLSPDQERAAKNKYQADWYTEQAIF